MQIEKKRGILVLAYNQKHGAITVPAVCPKNSTGFGGPECFPFSIMPSAPSKVLISLLLRWRISKVLVGFSELSERPCLLYSFPTAILCRRKNDEMRVWTGMASKDMKWQTWRLMTAIEELVPRDDVKWWRDYEEWGGKSSSRRDRDSVTPFW